MDSAAPKLNELLRHAEDLDKIISLKQEFTRKKAAVDSQLRSGLREQLETTQNGMTGLTDSHKVVQLIKEEMAKIDRLCSESQNMIRDLNTINLVSQAHRNFGAVEKMRKNLESFNERLIAIERMLLENDNDMDNMPNLLPVHYELTQLRNIRDDALKQIQRAEDTSLQSTLEDYFERLDGIIATFDKHIDLLSFNLINLVVNDNNGLVVRFAVVIDTEFKSDQRVSAVQEALRDYKDMATRFQGITDGAKKTRGYMERFQSGIKANAAEQFEQAREAFLADPTTLDKIMKWYFNDLNAVKVGMVPLVPKKWKVMQIYSNAYHQLMHDFLIAIINDPDTSSAMTLEIVGWPEKYYKRMTRLGFAVDDLQPHVIDNREQEMVRDFRQLIIKFLDEWMDRIFAQDTKDFTTRSAEKPNLDTDEFGYFRTRNQVDVRRMLREQVDVAANSQRADVVEGVVDAMFQRLRSRTQAWQKMLDDEAHSFESGTAAELDTLQPLQDWLVATANDQIASIDDGDEDDGRIAYLSDFRIKFEPLVSQQYLERAESELDSLRDGYVDFSTWCMTRFVTLIFTIDFGSVMPDFFTSKWYQANTMKQMVVTFEEYLGDYRAVLHHSLVDIFIEIFADELLVRYLGAVRNRGAKFRKTEPFQDKIFADVSTAFEYFSLLPNADVAASIKQTWRVMEPFLQLLTVDKDGIADAFEHFKMTYWDLQISWVEAVLRSRDDFERAMLNSVKARAAQIDVVRGPETIMGKIK
ncbi:SNARE-binding exocyst subunit S6 [Ceratocystis pirilliformis]|uniref:SNARE-binding exocyst subunit S6 n=1 Tax=Ceratocystis pirilliformis TaxID=259994 RepID=A0ABR3YH72_9PEZI